MKKPIFRLQSVWYSFAAALVVLMPQLAQSQDSQLVHQWNRTLIETIMEDGFGPPIAARIHAYTNVAAYQAAYRISDDNQSLVGQLNEFTMCPDPEEGQTYDWRVSMVSAYQTASRKLIYRVFMTDSLADLQLAQLQETVPADVFERSKAYGMEVANAVLKYSKGDNYSRTQGLPDWEWPVCDSCWIPTPPNFDKPLSPYCGSVRTIVLRDVRQFEVEPPIEFSVKPGSDFWKAAVEVMETKSKQKPEELAAALHWNDNPVVTSYHGHFVFNTRQISPGGHWMNIAMTLLKADDASMIKSLEVYTHTGLALFDAFTACWEVKYRSSLIRPVTYINRYIDKDWEPSLQTPPFPEHTSGHSTITAAAAEALTFHFGTERAFIDSTETEFGLPARSFPSLRAAASEANISRLWGGIHYRRGCFAGHDHGKKIGNFVIQQVKFKND